MTRARAKELLPIIQAFAEGKEIETKSGSLSKFAESPDNLRWYDEVEYRIKPEPREFWIVSTMTSGYHAFSGEQAAFNFAANARQKPEVIHVREVLP